MFEQTVFNGGKVHAGSQAGFEECLVDLVMRATGEAAAMNEEDQWSGTLHLGLPEINDLLRVIAVCDVLTGHGRQGLLGLGSEGMKEENTQKVAYPLISW